MAERYTHGRFAWRRVRKDCQGQFAREVFPMIEATGLKLTEVLLRLNALGWGITYDYLQKVMYGKRSVSPRGVEFFVKALQLNDPQRHLLHKAAAFDNGFDIGDWRKGEGDSIGLLRKRRPPRKLTLWGPGAWSGNHRMAQSADPSSSLPTKRYPTPLPIHDRGPEQLARTAENRSGAVNPEGVRGELPKERDFHFPVAGTGS